MEFLIIFLVCLLATTKVTIQGKMSKNLIHNNADAIFFNTGVFLISALVFGYQIIGCSPEVWIYGAIIAVLTVAYQVFYTKALHSGCVSLTVLMINLSLIIPTLFSWLYYKERLTILGLIGIVLTIVSFFVSTETKGEKGFNKKWLIYSLIATLSTALMNIVIKIFNKSVFNGEKGAFISISYLIAFCICIILLLIFRSKGTKKTIKVNFKYVLGIVAIGVVLALHTFTNNKGVELINGTIYYAIANGGTILLSTISGVVLFKDKLSVRQLIGVIIGIVAVILTGLNLLI